MIEAPLRENANAGIFPHVKPNESAVNVEEHLGLVRLCANRFRGKGIEYDDLYSAGCIGLLKAANAFEPERELKFSTYAVPVILGEIKRMFRDGGIIKVSRSLKILSMKTMRERENFIASKGREPQLSELSEIMGVREEEIAEALNVAIPPMSLTTTDDDDEEQTQTDIAIPAEDEKIINIIALRGLMKELDPNDRKLLYLRYFACKTQVQTAFILGMTQVQVSRREKKLLLLMRNELL